MGQEDRSAPNGLRGNGRALRIVGGLAIAFVLIQAVPYGRDHENPPMGAEPPWNSPATRERFMTACGDCHSHATRWPWYSHVAPISWLVAHDVDEGREHFNVSGWPEGSRHADEAAEEFEEGEMPIAPYLLTHPEARLEGDERQAFLAGLRATFGEGDAGGDRHHDDD